MLVAGWNVEDEVCIDTGGAAARISAARADAWFAGNHVYLLSPIISLHNLSSAGY